MPGKPREPQQQVRRRPGPKPQQRRPPDDKREDKPERPDKREHGDKGEHSKGWLMLGLGDEEHPMPGGRALVFAGELCGPDTSLPTIAKVRASYPDPVPVGKTSTGEAVTLRSQVPAAQQEQPGDDKGGDGEDSEPNAADDEQDEPDDDRDGDDDEDGEQD